MQICFRFHYNDIELGEGNPISREEMECVALNKKLARCRTIGITTMVATPIFFVIGVFFCCVTLPGVSAGLSLILLSNAFILSGITTTAYLICQKKFLTLLQERQKLVERYVQAPPSSGGPSTPSLCEAGADDSGQIAVLSQMDNGGEHQCGYHALKNALVGLGLAYQAKEVSSKQFQDREFYRKIFKAVRCYAPKQEEDVSIITLMNAFSELAKTEEWGFIQPLSSHISMFNSETRFNINSDPPPLNIGDVTLLQSVSHLIRLKKDPKAGVHACLMGFDGHWITIFYERDTRGNEKWYGTDSLNNRSDRFKPAIAQLKKLMNHLEDESKRIYEFVIGGTLQRKANWFNEEGNLKDSANGTRLISEKEVNLMRIRHAQAFIEEAGWKNSRDPKILAHLKNIDLLQRFYDQLPPSSS